MAHACFNALACKEDKEISFAFTYKQTHYFSAYVFVCVLFDLFACTCVFHPNIYTLCSKHKPTQRYILRKIKRLSKTFEHIS